MLRVVLFLFCLVGFSAGQAEPKKKTICLNMIVKNESKVIERCLKSVKNIIDYWVIVDTGSKDGTQTIIQDFMKDIPGELHEKPWLNFAHNRNEALVLTKGKADYVFVMDADDTLTFSDAFTLPHLNHDYYLILFQNLGTRYYRPLLIDNHLNWQWIGVLHEGLVCQEAKKSAVLEGVVNVIAYDGSRSSDPQKYQKDAAILEEALKTEPANSRYVFYLAQSYRDAGRLQEALKNYEKRVVMGGSDEEIFWSLSEIAKLQDQLQMPFETVMHSYCKAFQYKPDRAEPLYYLARKYRMAGNFCLSYALAKLALSLPVPCHFLFLEQWIYEYGILQEVANCAFEMGKYDEARSACKKLLGNPHFPLELRKIYQANLTTVAK